MKIPTVVLAAALFALPSCASAQSLMSTIRGFTEPYRSIDIAAPEMGVISQIAVEEGEAVNADQILARLNEDVLAASLAMANKSLEAKGKLNSALAELKMQQEKLLKLDGLFNRRHASQSELDRAKAQLEVAQAQVEAVQDELQIKAMEIKRIEAQLEQRRLRSPIDGVVTRIFKDKGEFVSANDPVVAIVVQLNPLLVIFSVPQEQATGISVGQTVELKMVKSRSSANGSVEFVSPTADAQSGTCRVKVRIDNPDYRFSSGVECQLDPQSLVAADSNSSDKSDSIVLHNSSPIIHSRSNSRSR